MELNEILGEELFKQVSEKLGDKKVIVNDGGYIPKAKMDEIIGSKNELKNQLGELTSQLETLKKSSRGNEELTKQIEELQKKNGDWEGKFKETLLTGAIKVEAMKAKAKDPTDVIAFLDKSKLEIAEDGTVKGLEDQLKKLQESKPYLFGEAAQQPGGGANPPGSSKTEIQQIEEQMDEARKKGNLPLVVALKNKLMSLQK